MDSGRKVALSDVTYRSLSLYKDELGHVMRERFGCSVQLKGPARGSASQWADPPDVVYEKKCGNIRISVWKHDMTRQDADAVVNAANERLEHGAGLALALAVAGGYMVEQESRHHVSRHGPVPTGHIVVTSGGDLPCKCIIHAVGPVWDHRNALKCKSQLDDAIKNILNHVNKDRRIRSVSIPAVSSGIFGFPLDMCAEIIVKTTQKFCQNDKCDHLREIRLVNNDDRTVRAMRLTCESVLGRSELPGGSVAGPSTSQGPPSGHQWPSATPHGPPSVASLTISALTLHLTTGCIEDQTTDVIVNSISENLSLDKGEMSKAILHKAGPQIQNELREHKTRFLQIGSVIATNGYRLRCQSVYHAILPSFSERGSEQVMENVVYACLNMVRSNSSKSISFPSLGTGLLSFPKDKVAKIMLNTITSFSLDEKYPLDVWIVIHPKDKDTLRAFENQFNKFQEMSRSPVSSGGGIGFTEQETKCVIINGETEEDIMEAETWLTNLLRDREKVRIQNNNLFLFGKREHDMLAKLPGVLVTEHLQDGAAELTLSGPAQEVIGAALQVEWCLLHAQEEQAKKMEAELVRSAVQWFFMQANQRQPYPAEANAHLEKAILSKKGSCELIEPSHQVDLVRMTAHPPDSHEQYPIHRQSLLKEDAPSGSALGRTTVDPGSLEFNNWKKEFEKANLTVLRIEQIHNQILSGIYQSRKDAAGRSVHTLYQRVPGKYCKLVPRVGFNRLYSWGRDSEFGAGIYFKKNLSDIKEERSYSGESERLVYIFQAEVLTGRYTRGTKSCILPPPLAQDALQMYDSVADSDSAPKTFVIFDGFCAVPQYLFTCKWGKPRGSR